MEERFNLEQFQQKAATIAHALQPLSDSARVIALSGELGAGKTTFAQALARALGVIEEQVTSPTFIIQKTYPLEGQAFSTLVHIDAYRLEHSRELLALGWEELIQDPGNLIIVEWPERVADLLPKSALTMRLTYVDETHRSISLEEGVG